MIIKLEFHNQNIVDTLKSDVNFIKALEKYEFWTPKPGYVDGTIIIVFNSETSDLIETLRDISSIILNHFTLLQTKNFFSELNLKINDDATLDKILILNNSEPFISVNEIC